jgi:hypothetical protein
VCVSAQLCVIPQSYRVEQNTTHMHTSTSEHMRVSVHMHMGVIRKYVLSTQMCVYTHSTREGHICMHAYTRGFSAQRGRGHTVREAHTTQAPNQPLLPSLQTEQRPVLRPLGPFHRRQCNSQRQSANLRPASQDHWEFTLGTLPQHQATHTTESSPGGSPA